MASGTSPIQEITVALPDWPVAWDGLRIAHLSDLHVTSPGTSKQRLIGLLARHRMDLVMLTGDYMTKPGRGQEVHAVRMLEDLVRRVTPTIGFFGCFGNNDSDELRDAVGDLPIRWLHDDAQAVGVRGLDLLHIIGLGCGPMHQPDGVAAVLKSDQAIWRKPNRFGQKSVVNDGRKNAVGGGISVAPVDEEPADGEDESDQLDDAAIEPSAPLNDDAERPVDEQSRPSKQKQPQKKSAKAPAKSGRPAVSKPPDGQRPIRFMLAHKPEMMPIASGLGVDVMFAGHTHGGQICLPKGRALYNSSELPLALSSGMLRFGDTIGLVSRGLGTTGVPLRLFCPPQLPIYRFRRGPMPGRHCPTIEMVLPW